MASSSMLAWPLNLIATTIALIILSICTPNSSLASSPQIDHYIVLMDSAAMPKIYSTPHHWHLAVLSSLESQTAASSKLIYSYTHVFDGFSCALTLAELHALRNSHGYLHSTKDLPVQFHTTHSPEFLGLAASSGAWEATNYGEGVIIGLVDTGVWPESQSFKDHGMDPVPAGYWRGECEDGTQFNASLCNNKLIGARTFNRSLVARNVTIAMNSARDEIGHGTHTSSTAAGNFVEGASFFGYAPGTLKGVAPRAHVAMYKLFKGALASDAIAAIDRALGDGVDVLSLSMGYENVTLFEDPIALATFAAVERNVFVAAAAGNSGPIPGEIDNATPWVLTVAAGTIGRKFGAEVRLGNGVALTGESIYPGSYSCGEAPIVWLADCSNAAEISRRAAGKIVVCEVGAEGDPVRQMQNSSAIAGIVVAPGIIPDGEAFFPFPVMTVTVKDGERLKDYISCNTRPTAWLEFEITKLDAEPAPTVTEFSSRGPSPTFPSVLKPDIMGPGFQILAAWPPNVQAHTSYFKDLYTGFNLATGTSMACPHLAGVAALIKKAHPDWSPAAIRSAMMTTADAVDHSGQPIQNSGPYQSPVTGFDMGAGQVSPNKALEPGLVYDLQSSDYVNLLCAMNFTTAQIRAITRSHHSTGSCINICATPSLDLNYPSFVANFAADRSNQVLEFRRTLTNVGCGMATYKASVTSFDGLEVRVIPTMLAFRAKGDKLSFKLVIENVMKMKKPFLESGYVRWIEVGGGNHVVQSPIVATN